MGPRVGLAAKQESKQIVIDNLNEQSKDVCIWYYGGGLGKVLDRYASQAVQPEHSFEALQFLQQQAKTTEDEKMQKDVDLLAVHLFYMHAPEVVLTEEGLIPTPLASHKLYQQ